LKRNFIIFFRSTISKLYDILKFSTIRYNDSYHTSLITFGAHRPSSMQHKQVIIQRQN